MQTKWTYLIVAVLITFSLIGCADRSVPTEQVSQHTYDNAKGTNRAIESGLLLGLALDREEGQGYDPMDRVTDEHRALWIYESDGKLTYVTKPGCIITPHKDGFWKIGYSKFTMSEPNDPPVKNATTIYERYSSYYNFNNITSHLAGEPSRPFFTKDSFTSQFLNNPEGYVDSYMSKTDWLLFVGNKYACLLSYNHETGGGTMQFSNNEIGLCNIPDLANYKSTDKTTRLTDLLDSNARQKLKGYEKQYNKTLEEDDLTLNQQSVDINNLALFRSNGRWQLKIPLYNDYYHQGNGSEFHTLKDYIDTDIPVPTTLTGYDSLCIDWKTIKQKYPTATDAVSSPKKDLLAVLTPTELLLFKHPTNSLNKPDLTIPVSNHEKIILNQWATGNYISKWTTSIKNY